MVIETVIYVCFLKQCTMHFTKMVTFPSCGVSGTQTPQGLAVAALLSDSDVWHCAICLNQDLTWRSYIINTLVDFFFIAVV